MRSKKLLLVLFFLLLVFNITACRKDKANQKSILLVGTSANFPPFEYFDEYKNYIGFDIELIKLVALKAGYEKVDFVNLDYEEILDSLKRKKIDVAAACISITEEKLKDADAVEYFTTRQSILVKKDNDIDPKSLNELSGLKVGVEKETIGEENIDFAVLDKTLIDATIIRYTSMEEAIKDLNNNLIDVLIVEGEFGRYYSKKGDYKVTGDIYTESIGFFIRKGNKELLDKIQNALDIVKKSSDWENLIDKYLVIKN